MGTTAPIDPGTRSEGLVRGRWIDHWEPEDPAFWSGPGAPIARRNLWASIAVEHVGFSVWTLWSVFVLFMGPEYGLDAAAKFLLVSTASFVGAVLRVPYTFAVARFGGRNWTIVSATLLLIPAILAAIVMHPGVSYATFVVVAPSAARGSRPFRMVATSVCSCCAPVGCPVPPSASSVL